MSVGKIIVSKVCFKSGIIETDGLVCILVDTITYYRLLGGIICAQDYMG